MIRNVTEREGHRDLQKETDGCKGVGCESTETEASDNSGSVCIESTLRTIVRKGDANMDPYLPAGELFPG